MEVIWTSGAYGSGASPPHVQRPKLFCVGMEQTRCVDSEFEHRRSAINDGKEITMWSDRETCADYLGSTGYVDIHADVCLEKDIAPLTLGVFGSWGRCRLCVQRYCRRAPVVLDHHQG